MTKKITYNRCVTSKDVARAAGVSQATVSRVFSVQSGQNVTEKARQKVLEAAKTLGYRPNFVARGMIHGKTNIVGIVVGEGMGPFYHNILDRLISEIQKMGKQTLIVKMSQRDDLYRILSHTMQYQVEAVIVTAPAMSKDIRSLEVESDIPFILFNRHIEHATASMVYVDAIAGGELAARCLCDHGHRDIACICYREETFEEREKLLGFTGVLRRRGIDHIHIEKADYTYTSGQEVFSEMLTRGERPSAIFCTSDTIALGAMDAARTRFGLRIPQDLSIIGFDDIPMAAWSAYQLTTIRQPYGNMVKEVLDMIGGNLGIHQDTPQTSSVRMIQPELIYRATVTYPPKKKRI